MDLQLFTDGSTMRGTATGGTSLILMARGATNHQWYALTVAQGGSFKAEKTVLQAVIAGLAKQEDWRKALLRCG